MSSKPTQFTLLRVKKKQKIQSSFQKRITAHFTFSEITTSSDWIILLGCAHVCYTNRESKKKRSTDKWKEFQRSSQNMKSESSSKRQIHAVKARPPSRTLVRRITWPEDLVESASPLILECARKKIYFLLTRLGDKWKDPWWFLWEGCEKELKCKPLRKRKREYKRRMVFSDVIL